MVHLLADQACSCRQHVMRLADGLLSLHQPPASGLQVYPTAVVTHLNNATVEAIVQWLKFKSFLDKLLAPLRSGVMYATSTLLHPLLAELV